MAPPVRDVSAAGLEKELETFRKGMAKALRQGNDGQLQELAATYGRLKAQHASAVQRERVEAARAVRARQEAQEEPSRPGRVPWSRWRHGRSPGAYERDRQPAPVEAPQIPAGGHLSPWRRRGATGSTVVWRG
jgi:hypothetical protein